MNELLNSGSAGPTMTSREIAELTGKRHDNVMRDIRKVLTELYPDGASSDQRTPPDLNEHHRGDRTQYKFLTPGTIDAFMDRGTAQPALTAASFEFIYADPQNGQQYPEFRLPKRETLVLIAGYSITLRAKIIDRWQELEARPVADPLAFLNDPTKMRTALLAYTEKVIALQSTVDEQAAKMEEQAPKVAALDRIATYSDGSFCVRDAAKTLQAPEKRLYQLLLERHWLYRRPMGSGWLAYSDKLQSGLMEHKITRGEKGDGSEWVNTQPRITAKGLARLARLLGGDEAQPA